MKQDAAFHGQGGLSDHRKANIKKYFHEVDRALKAYLRGDTATLLFAGVDYLYPLFADVTHHPHLLREHIAENPDRLTAAELHRQAEHLLGPTWDRKQAEALQAIEKGIGSDDVSDEVHVILPAAAAGHVKSLVVRQSGPLWGPSTLRRPRSISIKSNCRAVRICSIALASRFSGMMATFLWCRGSKSRRARP